MISQVLVHAKIKFVSRKERQERKEEQEVLNFGKCKSKCVAHKGTKGTKEIRNGKNACSGFTSRSDLCEINYGLVEVGYGCC